MPPPTPVQRQRIDRVESLIGLASPLLDLVLAAGERLSRIVGTEEPTYPLRPPGQAFELDRLARESRERIETARRERETLAAGEDSAPAATAEADGPGAEDAGAPGADRRATEAGEPDAQAPGEPSSE